MLEVYTATPFFIHVDIAEEVVKSVAQKLSGSAGPSGTDLEALQGWLLKFGYHIRKLHVSVVSFVESLASKIPPWTAYRIFMSIHLFALDNLPGVRSVGVRETCRRLFTKCALKVTGYEATHTCRDDHLCVISKAGIDRALHRVQYI